MKFEEHETLWETEKERKLNKKGVREDYLPLASSPDIQKETMKKLGIDGRTPEEIFLEELKEESKDPIINLQLN
jgi:hypothetical protein